MEIFCTHVLSHMGAINYKWLPSIWNVTSYEWEFFFTYHYFSLYINSYRCLVANKLDTTGPDRPKSKSEVIKFQYGNTGSFPLPPPRDNLVTYSPGWTETYYINQASLNFLVFLLILPLECWNLLEYATIGVLHLIGVLVTKQVFSY